MTVKRMSKTDESKALISKFRGKKETYDSLVKVLEDSGVAVKVRKGRKTVEFTDKNEQKSLA